MRNHYVNARQAITTELRRTGRHQNVDEDQFKTFFDRIVWLLKEMDWDQVYTFCERAYDKLLAPVGVHFTSGDFNDPYVEWEEKIPLSEVQKYYENELNNILIEENLAYHIVNGQFQRRGRAQTQKNIQRMGAVLADPTLSTVRNHYNRARKFFDQRPEPDVENCVKEAVCAMEACIYTLTKEPTSSNFVKTVRQIDNIPPTIAEGIIKLYAYRGDAKGVAHAAPQGSKVSEIEAELVLNLVASYVTYLVDLLSQPEEVPF